MSIQTLLYKLCILCGKKNKNNIPTDITTVQLTQEDYYELTRRAKEETSLADWQVSVSTKQRLVVETSQDAALRRLEELHTNKTFGEGT